MYRPPSASNGTLLLIVDRPDAEVFRRKFRLAYSGPLPVVPAPRCKRRPSWSAAFARA